MKKDDTATGGGNRVPISRARKYSRGIFIGCLGLVMAVGYLISEFLEHGSLTGLLQHLTEPSLIFYHIMVFLSIPVCMLIGYFYQKLKNAHERLEQMIEEKTWILRESEAVRISEEKFRNIFDSANDCLIYLDRSGRILDVNRKAVEVFGGSKKELLGKHFTRVGIFSLREIPTLMSNFANILAGKTPSLNVCIKNKKGQEIHLECSSSLMKIGEVVGAMVIARDVTERKKAEEKLRFLKEFNERTVDSIGDALLVIDPNDYTIISVNEATLKQLRLRKEDLIGKTCYETTHHRSTPCKPPHDICPIQEMLKTGEAVTVEHTHFDRDNNEIYVEVSVSPVRNPEGKIVQVVHHARDITDRKKAEEKIRNLAKFPSENSSPVLRIAKDGILLYANAATQSLLSEWKTGIGQPAPHHWRRLVADVLSSGLKKEIEVEHRGRIFSFMLAPVSNADYANVYGRDITERKRIEEALGKSEERYRSIVELAPDSIMTFDLKGVITSCNTASTRLSGYSKDELVGKHFTKIGAIRARDVPKYLKMLPSTVRGKVPKPFEVIFHRKNGTLGFGEAHLSLMKERGKTIGIQAIMRDVTDRRRMEDELKRYSEHLEELVEEKTRDLKESQERLIKSERLAAIGEVATMVGHDLRNPLQSIENATYYLNNELPRLSPSVPIPQKAIRMLEVIGDSVNYADKIIRDLQDFSATKNPILKKTNINAIVKEALSQVEAPENVQLITELGHLPKIKADKDMIKRVFLNLAVNGIQAMENGGKLKVSTKKTRRFVEVSFEDTGVGIPKENMEKLFRVFFTTKARGMGIGLAICTKFVDAHGGSFEVESEVGKGSTFTVKLPIQQENGGENP